jgi:hypothetical protein
MLGTVTTSHMRTAATSGRVVAFPEHKRRQPPQMPAPSWKCEETAVVTERSLVDIAECAGDELATRLRIPSDIVDVHRISESHKRMYSSLRYGAFLLTYAPLEGFFTALTGYAERADGRALPLNLDKIQRELAAQWPEAGFQVNLWEGRTRQLPTPPRRTSEWVHLKGSRLKGYLSDMKRLRDLLSHGGDPFSVTNDGRTLWKVGRGWSMRLMGVEGFIQFAEDLVLQPHFVILP